MSWQALNYILTRAMIDPPFARKLLKNPLATVAAFGFEVSAEELQNLCSAHVRDISELSQFLLTQLKQEEL